MTLVNVSPICDHASPDPPGRQTQGPCHYIPFHKRRNVATNQTATQPTYASTSTCLQPRQQAPLSLERKQHIFRRSQAQKSPPPESPPPTFATLIITKRLFCITKPLMDLGITGFHDLTSANKKWDTSKKHKFSKSTS